MQTETLCVLQVKQKGEHYSPFLIDSININMRFIVFIIFLTLTMPAFAGDYLILNLASWHHDRSHDYNESNEGIGLQLELDDRWFDYQHFGYYKNSNHRDSFYWTVANEYQLNQYVSYGYDVGLISGYSDQYPIVPFALPYVAIGTDDINLRTYTVPGVVYGFQMRVGF